MNRSTWSRPTSAGVNTNGPLKRLRLRLRASPKPIAEQQSHPLPDKKSNTKPRLLKWDEIEPWQQDNDYILSHYRAASYSYKASIASLAYLHNESVNIFTHLLGALALIALTVAFLTAFLSKQHEATLADAVVVGIFLTTAIGCLSTSTIFHTMIDHSRRVWQVTNFADFMGILALITGSFYPGVYYGFYCHTVLMYTYWTMVSSARYTCAWLSQLTRSGVDHCRIERLRCGVQLACILNAKVEEYESGAVCQPRAFWAPTDHTFDSALWLGRCQAGWDGPLLARSGLLRHRCSPLFGKPSFNCLGPGSSWLICNRSGSQNG